MLTRITELKPGMTLSDAVLTPGGKVLLAANNILTANAIALLSSWEVETVYIRPREIVQQTLPLENISENIPENYYVVSPDVVEFQNKLSRVIQAVTTLYDFIRKEAKVPILALKEAAADISHTITGNRSSLHYLLLNNENCGDPAAHHGVTVSFIAGLIGKRMDYSEEQIRSLALSGLLHDVGKLIALTPDNPDHTSRGANWLKKAKGISPEILDCVRQHHERIDGRGYPEGLIGKNIHPYAKIISVANFYHNAACKDGFSNPFPILDKLSVAMFGKLDPGICHIFIDQIHDCLLRSQIHLDDGRLAQVIYFHQANTHQPIVKTIHNEFIDLNACRNLRICQILRPT